MRSVYNKLIILPLIALIYFSMASGSYSASKVKWYDFNSGIKLAKKLKRPIIIDFYADWCTWCKVMEKETFSNRAVVKKMKNHYIPIRVMTESNNSITYKNKTYSTREFSYMLGVSGLPTIVFMDKHGEFVTKIPGFIKADIFLPLLNYIKTECYKKNVSFKDYMKGKSKCK